MYQPLSLPLRGRVRAERRKHRAAVSKALNQEQQEAIQLLDEITAEAHAAGDKEVYRFDMTHIDGEAYYGNDWHPNIYQDEKMAGELTAYLRQLMNWY